MKDWNKKQIKFYKFFFTGKKKPVIIEAYNKVDAYSMLEQVKEKTDGIIMADLIDFKIEMPIKGISKRKRFGETYVWVGTEYTSDGWISEYEFNKKK